MMRLVDLQENKISGSLIGRTINGELITPKTKDINWSPRDGNNDFDCKDLGLTNLEGAPKFVKGFFDCSNNHDLTSLVGGPERVNGYFKCTSNRLTSLKGAPKIIENNFHCAYNPNLTSLKDIHKIITKMSGYFNAQDCPIKSNILGVLYIKGCNNFILGYYNGIGRTQGAEPKAPEGNDRRPRSSQGAQSDLTEIAKALARVEIIVHKYLKEPFGHKRVFECQCELQDADLEEYAKL